MRQAVLGIAVLTLVLGTVSSVRGESANDSMINWYHQHYPYCTMKDSIFTFESEFFLPDGFSPIDSSQRTPFQNWVANMPIWHRWIWAGAPKRKNIKDTTQVARSVHLPYRGTRQTDCGIPLRILAEWLYYQQRTHDLKWLPHSGDPMVYDDYLHGELRMNRKGEPYFRPADVRTDDDANFYQFMWICMDFASYQGLMRNCAEVGLDELAPGDLVIARNENGRRGEAYVVLEVIQNRRGERLYVVATGCADACDFHIPNLTGDRDHPWITSEQLSSLGEKYPHRGFYRLSIQ